MTGRGDESGDARGDEPGDRKQCSDEEKLSHKQRMLAGRCHSERSEEAVWVGGTTMSANIAASSRPHRSLATLGMTSRSLLNSPAVPDKTSYRDAGVNIDAQDEALREVRHIARGTFTPDVVSDIGLFGGLFRANFSGLESPILVSSTDRVGTKLRVAQAMKIHDTVGYDLVCHCVNDILVQGARPLFFLDYIGAGKLVPDTVASVIEGLARACKETGCVLIGGETAEMPGFYSEGEYDVAG